MRMMGTEVRNDVLRPWYCCPGHDGTPRTHIKYGAKKSVRMAEKQAWRKENE